MDDRNELYRTRIGSRVYRVRLMESRISTSESALRFIAATVFHEPSFTTKYGNTKSTSLRFIARAARCPITWANLDINVTGTTIEKGSQARTQSMEDREYSYYVKFRTISFTKKYRMTLSKIKLRNAN